MSQEKQKFDIEKIFNFKRAPYFDTLTFQDAILYAIGIGYSQDPMNTDDQRFTFEQHKDFQVFPTYATVLTKTYGILGELMKIPGIPAFNPNNVVHGEHTVQIIKPVSPGKSYKSILSVEDAADKGKSTLVTMKLEQFEQDTGDLVTVQYFALFIRNLPGLGYKGKGTTQFKITQPKREPDFIHEEFIAPNQAIIYRLNNDFNPLHIDPKAAQSGGFKKPILHGLCFYGIATKAVVEKALNKNASLIQQIQGRFTSTVIPGDTLLFKLWREGQQITFIGYNKETQVAVIKGIVTIKPESKL